MIQMRLFYMSELDARYERSEHLTYTYWQRIYAR